MYAIRGALRFVVLLTLSTWATACGSKLDGTYTNASGVVMLELKSGGKATMGVGGETKDCTHVEEGKQIRLTCAGDRITLRVNDDGSLWAPGFVGVMKKSK